MFKVSSSKSLRSKVEKVLQGTPDMKTLYYAITAAVDLKVESECVSIVYCSLAHLSPLTFALCSRQ